MNEYDRYLEDYLLRSFRDMKSDSIPRNYQMENLISLASKIEYCLETYPEMVKKVFKCSEPVTSGDIGTSKNIIRNRNFIFEHNENIYKIVFKERIEISDENPKLLETYFAGSIFENDKPLELKKISLWDRFGIFTNNTLKIHTPLINLYHTIIATMTEADFGDTVIKLGEILNINPQRDLAINVMPPANNESALKFGLFEECFSYKANDFENFFMLAKYLGKTKIVISWFRANRQNCCFFPFPFSSEVFQIPLFNSGYLSKFTKFVILTDSIELAGINQALLARAGVSEIVWISWYGERATIPHFNWDSLSNYKIYYLLKEHSGFNGEDVYVTAVDVKKQLEKVKKIDFKYIYWLINGINLENDPRQIFRWPTVYTVDELESFISKKDPSLPITYKQFKNDFSALNYKRLQLISPFIFERSASLICGAPESGKTWFALTIACALSIGRMAFEGWNSGNQPAKVLYLHSEDSSLEEKFEKITTGFESKEKNCNLYSKSFHYRFCSKLDEQNNAKPTISLWNNFVGDIICKPQYFDILREAADNKHAYDASSIANYVMDKAKQINDRPLYNQYGKIVPFSCRKLIVLDNLFPSIPEVMTILNNLVRELKRNDWAVIIVASEQDNSSNLKRLYLDSSIKVRKIMGKGGILKIGINVASSFKGESKFNCKFDFNSEPLFFAKEVERSSKWSKPLRMPRELLKKQISSYHKTGHKGKYIAEKLGISHSLVKKIKGELNLSKKNKKTI